MDKILQFELFFNDNEYCYNKQVNILMTFYEFYPIIFSAYITSSKDFYACLYTDHKTVCVQMSS